MPGCSGCCEGSGAEACSANHASRQPLQARARAARPVSAAEAQARPKCPRCGSDMVPHAPILVPEVGGERGSAAQATGQAMREAAACVMSFRPETLVLISPHSPRHPRAFGLWAGERLQGYLAQFNAPGAQVSLPNNGQLANTIVTEAKMRDLATWIQSCENWRQKTIRPSTFWRTKQNPAGRLEVCTAADRQGIRSARRATVSTSGLDNWIERHSRRWRCGDGMRGRFSR